MTTCSKGCVTLCVEASDVSHQFTKFGGHRPFGSTDITDLIFQVTLHYHMSKGPCNFMEGSSSLHIPSCQVW